MITGLDTLVSMSLKSLPWPVARGRSLQSRTRRTLLKAGIGFRGFLIKLMQGKIKSIAFLVFVSAVVGLGVGELVEAVEVVEAGAAARHEARARQLLHGRVENVIIK